MAKPSDFGPVEALEVSTSSDAQQSRGTRGMLPDVGAGRLLVHNTELESISRRDELTQLFDRRYLFERLEQELRTAEGFQRPLAFIAIELKPVSNLYHTQGPAIDISQVCRPPGQNAFKPKVQQT